jgi:Reverse transcriptase (RNA-dependent DNA polymerase)
VLRHLLCPWPTFFHIHFVSCRPITDRSKGAIRACIAADIKTYEERGFTVTTIHGDGEFNQFRNLFPNIHFNICSAEDHVPEVEGAIRTIKETIRATIHGMPYHRLPRAIVKELVSMATRTNNMLPHSDGISDTLSPATIVTGLPKHDFNTMTLEFGSYVQVYDGTSNNTKSRTLGAIATNPTGNSSGDHFFVSLESGDRIHRRSWTVLPVSDAAISRVEAIASNEGMPPVDHDNMINEYDPDDIVDESAYDRNYTPPATEPVDDHNLTSDAYTSESEHDDDENDSLFDDTGHHDLYDTVPTPAPAPPTDTVPTPAPPTASPTPVTAGPTPTTNAQATEERTDNNVEPCENEERVINNHENEEREEPLNPEQQVGENEERNDASRVDTEHRATLQSALHAKRKGLRNKAGKADYSYRYGFAQIEKHLESAAKALEQLQTFTTNEQSFQLPAIQRAVHGLIFTQMSAHKGIKKHGQAAYDALRKEFEQFKVMQVLEPLDAFTLTDEQKSESLRALSVIKEKRDGRLKGRTVADGSAQRGKFSKSETGSPTAASDAVLLTAVVDAHEGRDVAIADVTGAYLHAYMKEFISMRFTGWAVDLLCEVNPEYTQHVVHEGKTKALYVRCNKAIYGCVVSELFSQTLEQHGFTINPYDFCVANATIEGTQCTIVWYVDDTKISHVKPSVVSQVIDMLESHFGKMTVSRGAQHEFLGMHLHYLGDGTVTVHMPSYLHGAIDDSGLQITKSSPTPASASLLHIEKKSPLLNPAQARTFHSVVARLIYVGTRARSDILLALGFLCSRVSAPTEQDERKLQRLLEYLHGTIDLKLRLGANSLNEFTTWVDASFAVHNDMRSHTGGVISFGRGGLICKSKKQSINTKSSTKAELIGASDYLPNTIYVKMFMAAQGHHTTKAIFYQDNQSAIKMESNGKASCGQRSRHIDIRYFFITDHVKQQSITIEHCPTGIMLADFFTKPLQGSLFRMYRSVLLGEVPHSSLSVTSPSGGNEERVEQGNPAGPGDITPNRSTRVATAATDASHSFETYPVDATAV